jgi:hypothetical protein
MNVLKVHLPVLKYMKRTETQEYLPSLTGLQTPPATLLPPVEQNSTFVPWTALGDPQYGTAQARRTGSPFYRVDRDVVYELIMHQVNMTSTTQRGVELSITSGFSETRASESWKQYGIGVSVESGWEAKMDLKAGGSLGLSQKVTASFNHSWGEKRSSSFTELEQTTRTFRMDIPARTAVALYQKCHTLSTWRHEGYRAGQVAWTKYGLDSYFYCQYPPPEDLDTALSWVPPGVEVLTPWGRAEPGRASLRAAARASAGRRQRQAPADVLMRPLRPRSRAGWQQTRE